MPYTLKGNTVINKKTGKVRKFKSAEAAKKWMRFNLAREHGWTPTR